MRETLMTIFGFINVIFSLIACGIVVEAIFRGAVPSVLSWTHFFAMAGTAISQLVGGLLLLYHALYDVRLEAPNP